MWTQLYVKQEWERMVGFTVPAGGLVIVIAYEGLQITDLRAPDSPRFDEEFEEGRGAYDHRSLTLRYEGRAVRVLGRDGGVPITRSAAGETLRLDRLEEILTIVDAAGRPTLEYHYVDASGDWAYATFSDDLYVFSRT